MACRAGTHAAVGAEQRRRMGSCRASYAASYRPDISLDRDFDIVHGAAKKADQEHGGEFRDRVDACAAAVASRVVVPAGRFLTGPVHLKTE
jgi:hypothetical protein